MISMRASLLFFATLPLVLLLLPKWLDPYALFDPEVLNRDPHGPGEGRVTRWCNMGYWDGTISFPIAADQLGRKLLDLAYEGGYGGTGNGHVLDIAHGSGESLLLHLSSAEPPKRLSALTPLSSDTARAKALVESFQANTSSISSAKAKSKVPVVDFYTFSAPFRAGRDVGHPLDRMKGYLGERTLAKYRDEEDEDDARDDDNPEDAEETEDDGLVQEAAEEQDQDGKNRYDLIYILDAIYHFPPSLPSFLSSLLPVLSHHGMVVYTDILPPAHLPIYLKYLVSHLLSVPYTNLHSLPAGIEGLEAYEDKVRQLGFEDVVVRDWSEHVWSGFAASLEGRGGIWNLVGWAVRRAEKGGWRFVAVRARKGNTSSAV